MQNLNGGQTWTSGHTKRAIGIPCRQVTPFLSRMSCSAKKSNLQSNSVCKEWQFNWYEHIRQKVVPNTNYICRLDCYNDHNICETIFCNSKLRSALPNIFPAIRSSSVCSPFVHCGRGERSGSREQVKGRGQNVSRYSVYR